MEVMPGYKQTEVGVIPEDWDVVSIGEAGQVLGGRQRSPHNVGEPCKYLRVANVFDGFLETEDVLKMPFTAAEKERFLLRPGDILLNEGQSIDLVGRSAIYRGIPDQCCFQNTLIRFRANRTTCIEFAQLVFQQYLRLGVFASIALQTTSIAHLGSGRFAALKMPLPPLPEQEAIAEVLGKVDTLIEHLERLIAKKRLLKRGVMRELLTGKERLPGFSRDWETKRLGDIAAFFSGGTPSTAVADYYAGDIPWITSGDLNQSYIRNVQGRISKSGLENSAAKMVEANTLLIALYGATAGVTAISEIRAAINQAVLAIVPRCDDTRFLYFKLTYLKDWLITTYTQGGQPNLSGEIVKSVELSMPGLDEQVAIAALLSAMDAEIALLEAQLAKYRQIKQGLMQNLLTGRIRLVDGARSVMPQSPG
jgi:type I restriction enzyme S subunit